MNKIIIKNLPWNNKNFIFLCNELDSYLNEAIGGERKNTLIGLVEILDDGLSKENIF